VPSVSQVRTISEAASKVEPGDTVVIHSGVYRETVTIEKSGTQERPIRFEAAPGENVVITGIERNLIVGNREGFNFREQGRKTPLIDDEKERWIWNHDERISNNVFALNRDAQVWGWFDIDDGRHWPAALQIAAEKEKGKAARDLAAGYQARDKVGAPSGLTLETLKITFDNNLYDARTWQGLFHWGAEWKRHKQYANLGELRAELKFERAGLAVDFNVKNPWARDFRVPSDSPALKARCYPIGDIPGVKLGILPSH
jgi:hypothetical protein